MRLDKLLSNMGYGSRKDVKLIVKDKRVTVNSTIIKDSGIKIDPNQDVIMVDGIEVVYKPYIYIMMNKPPGVISATVDRNDKTVVDILSPNFKHYEPFPVGRLDKDTEGLLLITNDGQLAHHLLSPKKDIEKTYYARILGNVTDKDIEDFAKGIILEDGYHSKPAKLFILKSGEESEIEITITEGKYHQVKRMFEAVGKKVIYLKRISMGELKLDETLKLGTYRELNEAELSYCLSIK